MAGIFLQISGEIIKEVVAANMPISSSSQSVAFFENNTFKLRQGRTINFNGADSPYEICQKVERFYSALRNQPELSGSLVLNYFHWFWNPSVYSAKCVGLNKI